MKSVYITENNIISALGFNSHSNIENISKGISGIKRYSDKSLLPIDFYSSIIDKEKLNTSFEKLAKVELHTTLEKMMILSLQDIISKTKVDLTDKKTALIISSTKGNVDVLDTNSTFQKQRAYISELGKQIQQFFGFKNEAIVVSNACVSGILAVAVAKRLIQSDLYENVFITSGDLISKFILSGFNSFKAISDAPCKPFSKNRTGITLGEAAASVLVTSNEKLLNNKTVKILGDASCNDANHISGPSRTGEGLYRSIQKAFKEARISPNEIDYISGHGTATMYNDEMEAIAMNRAQLSAVPINSLKGYYGHTLGASGLLETIVGIHSLHNNTLYQSLGFDELGVTQPINVIEKTKSKTLNTFLKTASGFGGCNTAVIFQKPSARGTTSYKLDRKIKLTKNLEISTYCSIINNTIYINGKKFCEEDKDLSFSVFAKKVYKDNNLSYSKFFKMDNLSKLAFLGATFLFEESKSIKEEEENDIAIVLSNRASSLDTDRKHQGAIDDKENYFPSPAVFVYTLPNIAIGEISIKYQLKSENAFFIFEQFNADFLQHYSAALIQNKKAEQVLCGWVDFDKNDYHAFLYLVSSNGNIAHSTNNIIELFNRK